jgi:glutamine synthetase adenylyltransferase
VIRVVLCRPREREWLPGDVVEMRQAIATEKGEATWDLKYVAGGLVDIEFIAQYLQLVHAPRSRAFSIPRPRGARQGVAARACSAPRTPRCCGRRGGSITT